MWNNRVWKTTHTCGDEIEEVYSIKETYYNSAGDICACTEQPAEARGYSLAELKENLERMLRVASMEEVDVINEDGFVFAPFELCGEEDE